MRRPAVGFEASFILSCLAIIANFVSGIVITTYNKWLMHTHQFPFPVTLIMASSACNSVLCLIFLSIMYWIRGSPVGSLRKFLSVPRRVIMQSVVPVGLLFSLDITMTNAAFMSLSVALTEVIKSCVPVVLLADRLIRGQESCSISVFLWSGCLVGGMALSSASDFTFYPMGFVMALIAMGSAAAKLIYTERMVHSSHSDHHHHHHTSSTKKPAPSDSVEPPESDRAADSHGKGLPPLLAMLYLSPVSFLSLLPPFFIFEFDRVQMSPFFDNTQGTLTAELLLLGGCLAFCLVASEFYVIYYTSALTYCVVGVARVIFIVVFTNWFFTTDQEISLWNELGLLLSLCGVMLYNYSKLSAQWSDRGRSNRGGPSDDEERQEMIPSSQLDQSLELDTDAHSTSTPSSPRTATTPEEEADNYELGGSNVISRSRQMEITVQNIQNL